MRQGWGRKMIGALAAHLADRGERFLSVCGVSRDSAGYRVYTKLGFTEIADYGDPPFYANWGGKHVHIGKGVYANFRLTLVDDAHIYIGDHTMIGPNVTLTTATHPVSPALRERGIQYNKEIRIGKNVWIGAGVTVLPGVTIGDNSVIGAGAVVTRDIPANVVAVGVPCRVMRAIGEHDLEYYDKDKPIDL